MGTKLIHCTSCGKEISKQAKICPHCGAKNKKPIFTKWWFWVIIIVIIAGIIGGNAAESETGTDAKEESNNQSSIVNNNEKTNVFSGDCGISATAEMGTDIIGQPTVTVSIKNITNKDINAIKFYAIPYDVYGEEITGLFVTNQLYTDNTIAAGKSETCTWQFLEDEIKTIKLYVYSVYFSDGSEWGDREATKSTIKKNALEIIVDGTSGK